MDDSMKSNLQLGLLVLIAVTVIYGTFIKEDSLPRRSAPATAAAAASKQPSTSPIAAPQNQLDFQQPAAQTPEPAKPLGPPTSVAFAEMSHDFGAIKQDTENEKIFMFTNTGDNPLIIENARGSCGCTVPEWPREPIAPGATGEIRVVYKPGKQKGKQAKTVTITANTEPRDTRLTISAEVAEEGA